MKKLKIKNVRCFRNVMMILIVIILSVGVFFTISGVKTTQNQPPQMPSGQMQNDGNMPSNSQTPPEKPDGDSSENSNGSDIQKPDNEENNNGENNNGEKSSNESNNNDSSNNSSNPGANGQMPNGQMPQDTNISNTQFNYNYIILAVLILLICTVLIYLIMSSFNKKSFKKTFASKDKIMIYVLCLIISTSALSGAGIYGAKYLSSKAEPNSNAQSQSVEASASTEVDSNSLTLSDEYTSDNSDESAILVKNGGNATIDSATISKTGGDSSNTENSEFYGVNSAVLVQKNSTATIKNANITSSAKGSNAVFSTGEDSKIYISDSTITTTGESSSRGLDATYGGYIEADNVKIKTSGGSCATVATDRGEGTVKVTNSSLETNGSGSPVIYSTGNISLTDSTGVANGSQMVVIEGKNSAAVTNSKLTANANGNRGDVDVSGVMIYQSMSGDAGEGTGTFTSKNSTLSIPSTSKYYKTAPMFFVTNTDAVINLNNTKLSFGSGVLLSAKGTSEWGNEGSNGGNVTLNCENQTISGDIEADKISEVTLNLKSTTYKGSINNSNTAKKVTLTLDKNSKITLTSDTYVTSLEDEDTDYSNIDFNGYKLYVNSKSIN